MRNSQLNIQPENFEFQFESPLGEFEETTGEFDETTEEFESDFGEFEQQGAQRNWYYFDAWWRAPGSGDRRLANYGPRQETESNASRLFDVFCLNQQNNSRNQGAGKLLVRCYQWFPVTSRWVACRNVVGFRRGMCASDESEVDELEPEFGEFETLGGGRPSPPRLAPGGQSMKGVLGVRLDSPGRANRRVAPGSSTAMEGELGFDSPRRAARQVRARFVNCNPPDAATAAITGPDPVGVITRANVRSVEMLDNAINQLQTARTLVRRGANPVAPTVSDAIRQALQNNFGMNAGDRNLWTRSSDVSILTLIRRLRGARQILADGSMRYTCLGPEAPATMNLGNCAPGSCVTGPQSVVAFTCSGTSRIVLCRRFWRDAGGAVRTLDFQALTLVHEAVHIYFGIIRHVGVFRDADNYENLARDLNI